MSPDILVIKKILPREQVCNFLISENVFIRKKRVKYNNVMDAMRIHEPKSKRSVLLVLNSPIPS